MRKTSHIFKKATIFFFVAAFAVLGGGHLFAIAAPIYAPGETLNPSCSPTDPNCTVTVIRAAETFVVADLAARDALTNLQAGDAVVVTDINETFRYTQDGTWQLLSKTILPRIILVADLAARDALTNLQVGDVVVVTDLNETFAYTQTGTWQEFSKTLLANTYVVPDIAALNALPNLQAGDVGIVTGLGGASYVRTQFGTWQEIHPITSVVALSIAHTYVVADEAARDALTEPQAGDVAVVLSSNTTYIYTQLGTWQQLLTPVSQVLSVNAKTGTVVLNSDDVLEGLANQYFTPTRAHAAFSAASPLTYDPSAGAFSLSLTSPLVVNGSSLSLDPAQLNLDDLGGTLSITKGGTGAATAAAALTALLPDQSASAGKFLMTDGTQASWMPMPGVESEPASWDSITGKPTTLAGFGITDAFSGAYADLTGKPTLFSGSYADLTDKPTIPDGTFASLSGKPTTIAGYGITDAFSGSYADLTGKPTFDSLAPTQTGNTGKFLTTNGSVTSWAAIPFASWGSITGTLANQTDLVTALAAKEPTVTAGTTGQYYRGDKSWRTLDKSAIGLGNVENIALATWPGSANITTLGTIVTGVWNGTAIALGNGGTGATSASGARTNLGLGTLATQNGTFSGASSGTNTGDVTIGTGNGLSLSGQSLSLAIASASVAGALSSTDWGIFNAKGNGTVTSVTGSGGTTGLTLGGGPITTSGTLTLGGILGIANGGTGQTSYTDGQLLIGNSTGNTLTKATLTAGSGISITNGPGSITISNSATNGAPAMLAGTSNNTNTANGRFYALMGDSPGNGVDSSAGTRTLISRGGTIKNLYVILSGVVGSGKTNTYTIYKNGIATALAASVSGTTATSGNDTIHGVSVVAGDEIGIEVTSQTNTKLGWAVDFTN